MGSNTVIGYIITAQSIICTIIYTIITVLWYWSKSINFTSLSEVRPIVNLGLWHYCTQTYQRRGTSNDCASTGPLNVPVGTIPSYVHVVRCLMIISIFMQLFAVVCCIGRYSSELSGKVKGWIDFSACLFDFIANVLVIASCSYWAARTVQEGLGGFSGQRYGEGGRYKRSPQPRRYGGGGMTGLSGIASTLEFNIGNCCIIGWVFGSIGLLISIVGLFSYFVNDYRTEAEIQQSIEKKILTKSVSHDERVMQAVSSGNLGRYDRRSLAQMERIVGRNNKSKHKTKSGNYTSLGVDDNTASVSVFEEAPIGHGRINSATGLEKKTKLDYSGVPQNRKAYFRTQTAQIPIKVFSEGPVSRYQPGYKERGNYESKPKPKLMMVPEDRYV